MGAAAIIPSLVGLAGAGLTAYMTNKMMKDNSQSQQAALQQLQGNQQNALDTLPETPEAPTNDAADAETNAAEAERQRQLQLMAANEKAVNPTGGLGVTTAASTKKRTLGGV